MSSPEQRIGTTIAEKYRIRRILGSGGMGIVYEAQHAWTGRAVAVKVLRPEVARDASTVDRFLREAQAAASIEHPNVVDVLDMGRDGVDGAVYLVLELLHGESLAELLHREGPLAPAHVETILGPVMLALAEAHDRGIVHRDLKPENVFVCRDPKDGHLVPKLLDFGIAK